MLFDKDKCKGENMSAPKLKSVKASNDQIIPMQEASLDIWDKKYRLKDKESNPVDSDVNATYERVAKALSDVEGEDIREMWKEKFLWALQHGAIPAGRIISNAGAQEYKPATSTINCTVSGIVPDSMVGILEKNLEAGLTLKRAAVLAMSFQHCVQKVLTCLALVLIPLALSLSWIYTTKCVSPFRPLVAEEELKWLLSM